MSEIKEQLIPIVKTLIEQEGYATQAEVARYSGLDTTTIALHWDDILKELNLHVVEMAIPAFKTSKAQLRWEDL